jgi:hypothetical protein
MKQIFEVKYGEISFENDTIIISDNANKLRRQMLLTTGLLTIAGACSFYNSMAKGDLFLLWIDTFIGIGGFVLFLLFLYMSGKSEIPFDSIKSIKVKHRFKNSFLDIKLKYNRIRRVILTDNTADLEECIEFNFKTRNG